LTLLSQATVKVLNFEKSKTLDNRYIKQEGQHPLTGQRAANFRLLAKPEPTRMWANAQPDGRPAKYR